MFLHKLKIQTSYHRLKNKAFFREECFASYIRCVSSCPCNPALALNPGRIGNYCNVSSFFNGTVTVWTNSRVLIILRGWFATALYSVTFKGTSQARPQLLEQISPELKCSLLGVPKPNKKLKLAKGKLTWARREIPVCGNVKQATEARSTPWSSSERRWWAVTSLLPKIPGFSSYEVGILSFQQLTST